MRRFGWQIGGLSVALLAVLGLGMLAFGCGSPQAPAHVRASATVAPRATATADPRVAQVEDAARRYVQALGTAMKTGSPDELDSLSVPGSQAEGNAGVAAHVVHDTGRAFVVTALNVTADSATLAGASDATAVIQYSLTGYDAEWPSMKQVAAPRTVSSQKSLEFSLVGGRWLVEVER
jgi:3-oxoacyl-ACP reductase-like protein